MYRAGCIAGCKIGERCESGRSRGSAGSANLRPPGHLHPVDQLHPAGSATLHPVTYVMEGLRSLVLEDLDWADIGQGFLAVAITGALMQVLNERVINGYD